jgi:hypothetical protein
VHPNPSNDAIIRLRPVLHDAIADAYQSAGDVGAGAASE